MENEEKFVSLVNVNKVYDKNVHAVYDFNLDIKKKEFIVFVGPSGCGKSTTLRMIAGLEEITSGELYIDGVLSNDILSKQRDIAMVFQNYALYPNMTVYDNMAFSLKVRRTPKNEIRKRVLETAKILDIEDYLDRKPRQLSGGQRQRVALGRAIVRNARLFLMDEPLSNLDAKLRVQMRSEIIRIHKKIGTTTIYVTHDQTEAMTMADRIVVMRGGYIQQIGTPYNIYRHPANKFVASFIGSPAMNFIDATYDKGKLIFADGFKIRLLKEQCDAHDAFYNNLLVKYQEKLINVEAISEETMQKKGKRRGKTFEKTKEETVSELNENIAFIQNAVDGKPHDVIFGIRPESIKKVDDNSSDANSFEKIILLSELLGDESYVHIDFGGKDVLAKIASENLLKEGQKIRISIKENRIHLFDKITKITII
ncbi:MAG TPA: ATP-binding cassette domain-containing protein [Erysipelotrichaceae bacterium]|nr:ATP-binding cassette domain-containing protein [Erysipelotrichaceae bacterium]